MIDHPMFLHRLHLLCNPLIDNVFIGIHPNFPTYPPLPFHLHPLSNPASPRTEPSAFPPFIRTGGLSPSPSRLPFLSRTT